ncbi:MAG: hypothetical protein NT137_04545 [Methanomassiliicoccales archaeon]|nr:hypothetical protein [Methanomassiliicoccales archaeon]
MAKKEDLCDEECAREMAKMLEDVGKELEKVAERVDRVSQKIYAKMPDQAKDAEKRLRNIANAVVTDMKQDVPKIQKDLGRMGKRLEKYLDDVYAAMGKP